ncbi:Uncharacterised protein [Mycobacterium tuberculosis]|nr:hypothetical protein C790_02011 [Morganella morganii SC01]SGC75796.1 Uncharacterised protein [Mycobacterium tuberculosis]
MSLVQVQLEEPNLKACSLSRLFSFLLFFFFRTASDEFPEGENPDLYLLTP